MKLHDLTFMNSLVIDEIHPEWPLGCKEGPINAKHWKCWDGQSSEKEVIEFLYALVRLVKPRLIVETGPFFGYSTAAMAAAQDENGFGCITSIEIDINPFNCAMKVFRENHLENRINLILGSSLDKLPTINGPIDLLFSDSHLPIRGQEVKLCLDKMSPNGLIVMHDTSPNHGVPRKALDDMEKEGLIKVLHFPCPRGLSVAKRM